MSIFWTTRSVGQPVAGRAPGWSGLSGEEQIANYNGHCSRIPKFRHAVLRGGKWFDVKDRNVTVEN